MKSICHCVLFAIFSATILLAQTNPRVSSFEGIDLPAPAAPNENGAVGTKQYAEVAAFYLQAWDKVTHAPVWKTYQGISSILNCGSIADAMLIFDHLAQNASGTTGAWVVGAHSAPGAKGPYNYCIAVSNTDDLSSSSLKWFTYQVPLDSYLGTDTEGDPNYPDWPKIGTWWNAYFLIADVLDPDDIDNHRNIGTYMPLGIVACALDRTSMLLGKTARPAQCFSDPDPIPQNPTTKDLYLRHSLIPADIDGPNAPPANRDEFLVSIQNPPFDLRSTTSKSLNLWTFHLDWSNQNNSSLTKTSLTVPTYTPACYNPIHPLDTICVVQPSTKKSDVHLDSAGDRMMPRFAYRNFGSHESFLITHAIQPEKNKQTGLRWYELGDDGNGNPALHQSGTVNYDKINDRFVPSIAEDKNGDAAISYSLSGYLTHPSIYASWWNLKKRTKPVEFRVFRGHRDANSQIGWGTYPDLTIDPVDDCTFWYVNEYVGEENSSLTANTRISSFALPGCN